MLPEIQDIKTQDKIISQFLGLNQKDTSNDQMFKNMENMTSDEYPYLAPRNKAAVRHVFNGDTSLVYGSCVYGEDIYTVQGQRISGVDTIKFYKNFEEISEVELDQQLKIRDLVVYGAYIVIFPDNVMYNTETEEVVNMSYEVDIPYTSTNNSLYLSDKDGVPFILDNNTSFSIDGQTTTPGGFNGIISGNMSARTPRQIDNYIHNAILTSYLKDTYCKYLGLKTVEYAGETDLSAYKCNICMGQKEKAYQGYQAATTYPLYWIEKSGGEFFIKRYQAQNNAWYPADLYVSWRLTRSNYEDIKDKIKIGDFINLKALKSDGTEYKEEDFNGKEATYNFVNKLSNGIKVENILTGSGAVVIVFSNASLNFLKVLQEQTKRFAYDKYATSSQSGRLAQETVLMRNQLFYPAGTAVNSLAYSLRIEKTVPDMDYITVSQNRIWGCSSENHEIYACKQGDATAWYNYAGLSSDSYAVTIPNGDKFTGAVTYSDMPYFFTENMAYSIMGNKPKNYQVQNYELRGVEDGAYQTIAQKDGYVYYKSKSGIERFNGNNAQLLTEYLDLEGYRAKVGAVNNDKYFVFMGIDNAHTRLYVYDIKKRLWHIDRKCLPNYMIELDNNLYLLNGQVSNIYLEKINGKSREVAPALAHTITYDTPKWFVESGEFNGDSILKKYITKLMFELKLEQGSKVSILFMYDDSGEWEEVFRTTDKHVKKLINVPLLVRRCERLRYKIKGEGQAKIYTITFTYEGGSEIG